MSETKKNEILPENEDPGLKDKIAGVFQRTIGGIEEIGGILTGDPNTAAEGEFNVEVGRIREETAEDLEEGENGSDEN